MRAAIVCNIPCESMAGGPESREELISLLNQNGYEVLIGGVFTADTQRQGVNDLSDCFPIQTDRDRISPLSELRTLFSTARQIRKNRIDTVIVYGIKNHSSMAVGAALGGAKRILCVVNGKGNLFRVNGLKGTVLRLLSFPMLQLAYRLAHAVCFQNEDDRALFLEKRLVRDPQKAFVTNGSGVNLTRFSPAPLPREERFLYLARITPTKGIREFLEAAAIVKRKVPGAVFDIVGPMDAAVEGTIDNLVQKACENGVVSYHGPTDNVPLWLSRCRYFVYPSYYPEGVPRCAIQAAACGRPVLTCNTPGCRETVVNGVTGFAVEPESPELLAEKMIWMTEHPEEVSLMAKRSRELAERKFDVNEVNAQILKHLDCLR